ncbi:MAG: pirin family protein, partial [Flavobacteriales bacterium]|nr:pirin family protein [Flavobacteriales bacterium]
MNDKKILRVIPAEKVNMGGIILDQPLPASGIDQIDPFLLIHHWDSELPGGQHQRDVGVGPHPHRGFSPVTFVFKGDLQHRDSLGNDATVTSGGTQWMHAGRGITHSERPSAAMAESGGPLEFIQFWVNSPAAHKMDNAFYLPLSNEETPRIEDEGYHLAIVAGIYEGVKGPAPTLSPMTLLRGGIKADFSCEVSLPSSFNTMIYLLDGELQINNIEARAKDLVQLGQDGEAISILAKKDTRFIVLSG